MSLEVNPVIFSRRYSADDGTMRMAASPVYTTGQDKLGVWSMVNLTWAVASSRVDTTIKMYEGTDDVGLQFVVLSQVRSAHKNFFLRSRCNCHHSAWEKEFPLLIEQHSVLGRALQ